MRALGPYAFMDIFDPNRICNHSDQEGRYVYKVTFLQCYSVVVLIPFLIQLQPEMMLVLLPTPLFCTLIIRIACIR